MDASLISSLRMAECFLRAVAGVVVITFAGMVTAPTAAAVQQSLTDAEIQASLVPSDDAAFNRALVKVRSRLEKLNAKLQQAQDDDAEKLALQSLENQLRALVDSVRKRFEHDDLMIRDKGLPAVAAQRLAQTRDQFEAAWTTLMDQLSIILNAPDLTSQAAATQAALDFLNGMKLHRTHQKVDPKQLPFHDYQPDLNRKPRIKAAEFQAAGLFDRPYLQVAALGDFTYANLHNADNPAYLAQSDEVRLSDAVKAKAAELDHDPVKIYHWVRNNVDFIPSWGSIQDADLTLASERGNAFDISSLLIALLRASGIPSRYVHGTVEMSADRFRNWVGGFDDVVAAANYASSGGMPVVLAIQDGVPTHVQFEHVWAEAAIDFLPSHGAVNKDADTWLALDASFKQYEYLPGLDTLAISGIDAEKLANDFAASGTINEEEGWVAGFDPTILEAAQQQAQTALETYINDNLTVPTVGDVIGGYKTIVKTAPVLPSGLPMTLLATGARYDKIPASLQHRLGVQLGSGTEAELEGPYTASYATLNNQRVTLSFRPATVADEETLRALLPDGEITDISQLPSSISAYLIQVVPELKVNGEVVKTGPAMYLGEELAVSFTQHDPSRRDFHFNSPVQGGSYLALGTIGGSVSPKALQDLHARITAAKTTLESGDVTQFGNLTREDLLGDMFHAGMLGYFAQYAVLGHIAGLAQEMRFQLSPSIGTYGYVPKVNYLFGTLPSSLEPGGVEMDLDSVAHFSGSGKLTAEKRKQLNLQLGVLSSALEHAVPEQMFTSKETPGEAVSAVKALQKAVAQGQQIYRVTAANEDRVLPYLHHDAETMSEIRAALSAGLEVVTHVEPIAVFGWEGSGYIILDPGTGLGIYKISGGLDGAVCFTIGAVLSVLFVAALHDGLAGAGAPSLAFALAILASVVVIWELYGLIWGDVAQQCFVTGLAVGLFSAGLLASFAGGPLGKAEGKVASFILALAAVDISRLDSAHVYQCVEDI